MSRSRFADAAPAGAWPVHPGAGSALAPRNWRVASRLAVLVAIPAALGLALTGLRVTQEMRSAEAYGQVSRLAMVSQQVTGLTQAMEDEQVDTAAFIAAGRPASGLAALHRQYAVTDGWAVTVRRSVLRLGRGYPARTRASAAAVLATLSGLPGLRGNAAQDRASALAVINSYAAATAALFPLNDGIADLSGSSALSTSVRTLGSLSRMKAQASQQQAILSVALAEGRFGPGALTALTMAQARQASDLVSFRTSATPQESGALTDLMSRPPARQAQLIEQRAMVASGGALASGAQPGQQWSAGMSYTVGWMRHAEQQLTAWITAYAQALRHNAIRSAITTGGAALAALILLLLITAFMARSLVRPLRRLEAAALEVAGVRLPAEIHALSAAGNAGPPLPVPIEVHSTDEIGRVARAVDRVHAEAVRLAGEEARLRASVNAIFASFFRRNHALLDPLLQQIDSLELGEDDPDRLASLFEMDHLATRLRRNSDSALALARHEPPDRWAEPVSLLDAIRAAVSEIEQYDRVILDVQPGVSVIGSAAADTVHLLAELLDNATTYSPPAARVVASGHVLRGGGSLISITDDGAGMPEEQLRQLNSQLAHPHVPDMTVSRHVGLFAVAQLAARHGIDVVLVPSPDGGTTAEVHLPAALISPEAKPGSWPGPAGQILGTAAGRRAIPAAVAEDPRPSALWYPAGPQAAQQPSAGAETAEWRWVARPEPPDGPGATPDLADGPSAASPAAVPVPLGAPWAAPAPSAAAVLEPADSDWADSDPAGTERSDAGPGGALPIFESVESDYLHTRGQSLPAASDPPARPLAGGSGHAFQARAADRWGASAADDPGPAGTLTSAGLPQRNPQASAAGGGSADQRAQPAAAAESAQLGVSRLASFQRGSRRARAAVRTDRDAIQSARDN